MENSQHTSKDQPKAEGVVKDGAGPGQVQAALRESEERYRSVFEQSIDAVLLTAPDGRILAANPAACQLFGRSEADLRQVGRTGVVDPADPRVAAALEERTRTGRFRGELTLIRGDGTRFPAEVSTGIYKNKDGLDRTSMIVRDTTERKRLESELVLREQRLNAFSQSATAGLLLLDKDLRFLQVNDLIAKITWGTTQPSDFPNYAAGTWGPEDNQRLLAPGHRWPLPTELAGQGKKRGKTSRLHTT